jgi:hypothetical protein
MPTKSDINKVYVRYNNNFVLLTEELFNQNFTEYYVYRNTDYFSNEQEITTDLTAENIYKER